MNMEKKSKVSVEWLFTFHVINEIIPHKNKQKHLNQLPFTSFYDAEPCSL